MKNKTIAEAIAASIIISILAGLSIGLVIIGGLFTFFQPTPKVEQSEKMKECINVGGQFSISDWSWKDDNTDYRMTCKIPEHNLWQYELLLPDKE